jgi:anti-sigma regulatory factor (Ser/Thr protein kinase)
MLAPGESYSETFPAVASSVPNARAAITEFAREAGAKGERLQAIRLAASEAVTNAVVHAYAGGPGSVQVTASYVPGEVWVLVADAGGGLHTRAGRSGLGLGLVLIAQLADDFEVASRGTGGTELRMRFSLRSRGRPDPDQLRGSVSSALAPA